MYVEGRDHRRGRGSRGVVLWVRLLWLAPRRSAPKRVLDVFGDSHIPLLQLTVAWQRVEGAVGRRAEGGDLVGLRLRIAPALVWTRCKRSYTQFCGQFNVSWRSPSGWGGTALRTFYG